MDDRLFLLPKRRPEDMTQGSIMMNEKKVEILFPSYTKFRKLTLWVNFLFFVIAAITLLRSGIALAQKQDYFKTFGSNRNARRWKHLGPPMEAGLTFIYMMIALSVIMIVISFYGLDGAMFTELHSLRRYLCLLSIVLFTFGVETLASSSHSTHGSRTARGILFKAYVENHYGVSSFSWIFTSIVDNFQAACHCCGYKADKSLIMKYRAQQVVLFWSEMTQWGLQKLSHINVNDSTLVALVPRSCCRNYDDETCNLGSYYDRINWSLAMDDNWSQRIYVKSCNKCFNYFNIFIAPGNYFCIFFALSVAILVAAMCFSTLYMYESIAATPNIDVADVKIRLRRI
uniref:Tetraspanin n=1 Tax=Trichuris muris TaxID=70415 RepID=A0A5S6QFR7_TRIMR